MIMSRGGIERGDRIVISLPTGGRVEALCIWTFYQRAGLQFERPIQPDAL
jgi:hypothetical protein